MFAFNRASLALSILSLSFGHLASAQPSAGDPTINSAADQLNQVAPQAIPEQTIVIGLFNGADKSFSWNIPVTNDLPDYKPGGDAEPGTEPGPHTAPVNSFNVTYQVNITNKPADFQIKLQQYTSATQMEDVDATINISSTKATINFHPKTGAMQRIKMNWTGGGQKNLSVFPKLKDQLGAFVVPHLLVAVVYEPPGGKSYASYSRTSSAGTVISWGFARSSGMVDTVNPDEMYDLFVQGMGAAVSALGGEVAGTVIEKLNSLKESTTTETTTENTSAENNSHGTYISLTEEAGTTAHQFPGNGDVFVILDDVLFMYVTDHGRVKLAPIAYHKPVRRLIASELQQYVPAEVYSKFVQMDPMIGSTGEDTGSMSDGTKGPKSLQNIRDLPIRGASRFKQFATWACEKNSYGEYELKQSEFNSSGTSSTSTETVVTHTTGLAKMLEGGGDELYGVTYTSSKQQTTGDDVVAMVHLECGENEQPFEVQVYYDNVFRTFVCKKGQPLGNMVAMSGTATDQSGQPMPHQHVALKIGDQTYGVISDDKGNFKFPFSNIPKGAGTLEIGKSATSITYNGSPLNNLKVKGARSELVAFNKPSGGSSGGTSGKPPVRITKPGGTKPTKPTTVTPLASEGDTATAIRGRPPGGPQGDSSASRDLRVPTAENLNDLAPLLAKLDEIEKHIDQLNARLDKLENGTTSRGPLNPDRTKSTAASSSDYDIAPNAELKGRLGRVVVAFPESANTSGTRIGIYKAGDEKNEITYSHGGIAAELMPGEYIVTVTGKPISRIDVRSGSDTKVHVGVLRVQAGPTTRVSILEPGAKSELAYSHGSYDFGLPPGQYEIEIAGQRETVTVKNGQITEF